MITSKFKWTFDNIRTEKIISVPILVTKNSFGGFYSTRCQKLFQEVVPRKYNDAPLRKWQKPNFGPSLGHLKFFSWVLLLLVVRQCSKLSSYAISRKTNDKNMTKNLILGQILAHLAHIRVLKFFLRILPLLVIRH